MTKKKYEAPNIEENVFAQFENVYTACNKNPNKACSWDPISKPSDGPGFSSHVLLQGSDS